MVLSKKRRERLIFMIIGNGSSFIDQSSWFQNEIVDHFLSFTFIRDQIVCPSTKNSNPTTEEEIKNK